MVNYQPQLDAVFAALAHPVRRAIIERLAEGDCSVGDLADPFDISWPAVTKHLRVLENAGLVRREKCGRVRRMHLRATPIRDINEWIERYRIFWEDRLDSLARHLESANDANNEKEPR